MATLTIPPGASFTVINVNTIEYDGQQYAVDGSITFGDGSTKTTNELLIENGGAAYALDELKRCFKVEGIDPDANGESWFSLYSSNSKQTGKNESSKIPGGMWVEWLDFAGEPRADGGYDNPVLQLWTAHGKGPADWSSSWIGFRIAYGTAEVRSYVATYQDDFLQESIPSPPITVDATFMHSIKLHGVFKVTPPDPSGHYYVPIRRIHLWRTSVGTDGNAIFRRVPVDAVSDGYNSEGVVLEFNHDPGKFTLQIPDPTKSYGFQLLDTYRDEDLLQETLESTDWDPPPFRRALQLVGLWNGMMAVHQDNMVLFCEPYRPHAWPAKYRYPLPYDIISKEVDGNTMIVTTVGPAYIFTGSHPSSMTYEALMNTQAGKRSDLTTLGPAGEIIRAPGRAICRTPMGVCYATDDGIVASAAGRSQLITGKLFTKDEWKARYGTKFGRMRLAYSNGKLLCWFTRTPEAGFIMDMAGTSLTEWGPSPYVGVAAQMPGSEGLYLMTNSGGTTATLQRFEDPGSNRMIAAWISRKAIQPKPSNFGCFQIVGSGGVTVYITAGPRVAINNHSMTLVDGVPQTVRLPHGFMEREWIVTLLLDANAVVREFYLATTPEELRSA